MSGVETFTQTKSSLGILVTHPGGGELRSPPPANLSRSAHQTWTHTRQTDPHGTRDKHTEPHETSTRDAHKVPQAPHIKLSRVCGIVSCLISLLGYSVCMLAIFVRVCVVPCDPIGSRHEHAAIQAKCRGHTDSNPESLCRVLALPLSGLAHLGPS